MCRQRLVLLVLLFTPTALVPQRYGRPYTLAENPRLLLQIKVQNKSRYFRASDLRKMHRSVVTLTDATANASHVYEGVALVGNCLHAFAAIFFDKVIRRMSREQFPIPEIIRVW